MSLIVGCATGRQALLRFCHVTVRQHSSQASNYGSRLFISHQTRPQIANKAHDSVIHSHQSCTSRVTIRLNVTDAKPIPTDESQLPSHVDEQRWRMSKRMHHTMDELLSRAENASKRLNVYTGTDYTGIEVLRRSIVDQGKSFSLLFDILADMSKNKSSSPTYRSSPPRKKPIQPLTHSNRPTRKKSSLCSNENIPGQQAISSATCP